MQPEQNKVNVFGLEKCVYQSNVVSFTANKNLPLLITFNLYYNLLIFFHTYPHTN